MATPTYELIETTTLTSSASSVTFSSITQDYRDLVLVADNSQNTNIVIEAQFNNDTGTNYYGVEMLGTGSSASSGTRTGGEFDFRILGGFHIVQIMDYSATDKDKTSLQRYNSDSTVGAQALRWDNTAAITEIDLNAAGGSFAVGTTFSLYGIAS